MKESTSKHSIPTSAENVNKKSGECTIVNKKVKSRQSRGEIFGLCPQMKSSASRSVKLNPSLTRRRRISPQRDFTARQGDFTRPQGRI